MARIRKKQVSSLASGRPPTFQRQKFMSRKATKALINKHHLLLKKKQQAISVGDDAAALAVESEIVAAGGLEGYQHASLQGQSTERGGDSSRVLMKWLRPCLPKPRSEGPGRLRMLEVGALSTENSCSRSGVFDMTRIDLNSQAEGIVQQDFMDMALPRDQSEQFDIISLSLVLNFLTDPQARGEMLLRTLHFLREPVGRDESKSLDSFCPGLFLVLPSPCVSNSRYLDGARLEEIFSTLGYSIVRSQTTQRLAYYLWRRVTRLESRGTQLAKKHIRSGPWRNNFAIVLKH